MPTKKVNINVGTPLGAVQIYIDPRDQLRAEKLIANSPSILTQSYKRGIEKFSNQLLRIVRKSLNTGMPPPGSGVSWPKHSPTTLKRYPEHPLLHLTGQYARSVTIVRTKNRTYVGLPIGVRKITYAGNPSHLTLNQVALILEYGSSDGRIPPRPLWAPAFEVAGGREAIKKEIRREVRKELRKYTKNNVI